MKHGGGGGKEEGRGERWEVALNKGSYDTALFLVIEQRMYRTQRMQRVWRREKKDRWKKGTMHKRLTDGSSVCDRHPLSTIQNFISLVSSCTWPKPRAVRRSLGRRTKLRVSGAVHVQGEAKFFYSVPSF